MNLENRNFISIIAIFIGLFGTMIFTYSKLDTKIDKAIEIFHQETKDFHGRLWALEEKYHQLDRRK